MRENSIRISSRLLDAVASIIRQAQSKPADAVLREYFRMIPTPRADSREITEAVFAYYRWYGVIGSQLRLPVAIDTALEWDYRMLDGEVSDEVLRSAVPGWVQEEMEVTPEWIRSLQRRAVLWLRAKKGFEPPFEFKTTPHPALPGAFRYADTIDLFQSLEFGAGKLEIQDVTSQAVGWICGPAPGSVWWDACAGEGGKTLHLCDLMEGKGLVWATDRAQWRLDKLRKRAKKAGVFNYRTALWLGKHPRRVMVDGVLVDAPCSGIGTWQRNPHARWSLQPADVRELAELQVQLVLLASQSVKRGGRLIYSVCTLTRRETEEVVRRVEAECPGIERVQIVNPLRPGGGAKEELKLKPEETDGNGMFVAVWEKKR